MYRSFVVVGLLALAVAKNAIAETIFLGPTPYLSAADSPFDMSGLGETFFLEDFEDGELNTPGIVHLSQTGHGEIPLSPDVLAPDLLTDSVDGDGGGIDGRGIDGFSLKSHDVAELPSLPPIVVMSFVFEFDADELGFLPDAVGFVWTDGIPASTLVLGVTDSRGIEEEMGWMELGDQNRSGKTPEDRFFGAVTSEGIARFRIVSLVRGFVDPPEKYFEIDHLQYGLIGVPEPPNRILALIMLGGITFHFLGRGRMF